MKKTFINRHGNQVNLEVIKGDNGYRWEATEENFPGLTSSLHTYPNEQKAIRNARIVMEVR